MNAYSFEKKDFWRWVQGVKLFTLPRTALEVVCKREAVKGEVQVGVPQVVCQQCAEVWERSGLKSTLQKLKWEGGNSHARCVFCIVNKCFAAHAFVYFSIPSSLKAFSFLFSIPSSLKAFSFLFSIPSSLKAFSFLFFFMKDPCLTTFRLAYNTAAENGFMDGVSKGLMFRFIDCVAENGVCQEHREVTV